MIYRLVYGLSADPIHQAHIELLCDSAAALLERGFGLRSALIVPVYRRNLPKDDRPASYQDRLAMCHIAAGDAGARLAYLGIRVEVSRIEEELAQASGGPNYTVETLAALEAQDPSAGLIFLMSSDLVSGDSPELGRWHQPEELIRRAIIAIAVRTGYPPNRAFLRTLDPSASRFLLLSELSPADMSGQDIRARLAAGEDPLRLAADGLLLREIAAYIRDHGLYAPTKD